MRNKKKVFIILFILIIVIAHGSILGMKKYKEYQEYLRLEAMDYYYLVEKDTTELESFNMYGESLNTVVNNTEKNTFNIIEREEHTVAATQTTKEEVDKGLMLSTLPNGQYYLEVDGKLLTKDDEDFVIEYTTVTRDNENAQITIEPAYNKVLLIDKQKTELPEGTCDIMIDPGHGGTDAGTMSEEQETENTKFEEDFALDLSFKLRAVLEDMGYTICMTRESDMNPGNVTYILENIIYNGNYGEGSRMGLPFEKKAKYLISLHFNAGGGQGYEVYSSMLTSPDFGVTIGDALATYTDAMDNNQDFFLPGEPGVAKKPLNADDVYKNPAYDDYDWMFPIRESGGIALPKDTPVDTPENPYADSLYGLESILVENGYIDNEIDLANFEDEGFVDGYVQVLAEGIDKYIQNR